MTALAGRRTGKPAHTVKSQRGADMVAKTSWAASIHNGDEKTTSLTSSKRLKCRDTEVETSWPNKVEPLQNK